MATLTNAELQFYSSRNIADRTWAEGDSYVGGAGGASFAIGLRNQGRVVISSAVGGSELADIQTRVTQYRRMIQQCSRIVIWDGSPNGYVDAESYADEMQGILDTAGIDFIVLPSAVPYGQADTQAIPIRDEFEARWPGKVCDWRDYIANTDGVIDENRMLDYPTDAWHLNQTAYDEAGAGVDGMIA